MAGKNGARGADVVNEDVKEVSTDAAVTAPESRDETHDSIDAATGALTPEAVARRQAIARGE